MPPEQRAPLEEYRPYQATRVVNMNDPDAWAFLVGDIGDLESTWRWTGKRPTVRLHPRTNDSLRYTIDFALADQTLKDTGPVTLSFFVGDHLLGSEKYSTAGQKHFEKEVPMDWIRPEQDVLVAAEIDKVWVSKTDGAKLGFILASLGFTQAPEK